MTSRARLVTALLIVVFIAFLVYSTLEVQRVECAVTVDFQGERRTATASGGVIGSSQVFNWSVYPPEPAARLGCRAS